MVDGFRAGQLHLKLDVPDGLARLADPYDPEANEQFRGLLYTPGRLHDTSYYHGKLYLYFGVTPALVLFWPWRVLTGSYLAHDQAVAVFCSIGFLASVLMLRAMWRREFPGIHVALIALCVLVCGLANSVPVMLQRAEVWEVPISCAYACVMLALAAVGCALREPSRRDRWLVLASLAYALAIGARPSVAFGAAILVVPIIAWWRTPLVVPSGRRRIDLLRSLLAVALPLIVVGRGLAAYNYLRFENIFEFGQRYQLAGDRQDAAHHFSFGYLWFNLRTYLLSFAPWDSEFPYVHNVPVPLMPVGHGAVDMPYGILTNTPVSLFAIAAALTWRQPRAAESNGFRWWMTAVFIVFSTGLLTFGLFYGTCLRYQVEFHPALVLLACAGLCASVQAARSHAVAKTWIVAAWSVCLVFSTAFSLLKNRPPPYQRIFAESSAAEARGDLEQALAGFQETVRLRPGFGEAHFRLGVVYDREERLEPALASFREAWRLNPASPGAAINIGAVLRKLNRSAEAAAHLDVAARAFPRNADIHATLGAACAESGQPERAVVALERALELKPEFAEARLLLALQLKALGRIEEARLHHARYRRERPDLPDIKF